MRAAQTAWLAPAVYSLFASLLYLVIGDALALAVSVWFAWSLTRACDHDHKAVRYLGWFMLVTIPSITLARFALG
jgi:uncharacterized membrane protein